MLWDININVQRDFSQTFFPVIVIDFQAIRVIANLSISPEAGAGIATNEALVDLLIQILGMLPE